MHLRMIHDDVDPTDPNAALLTPRRIRFASEIPSLGLNGFERADRPLRLRGVTDPDAESFVSANGAFRQGPFWVVARREPFPYYLGDHLPRIAQPSLVPEIVDMEPAPGWRGCLEGVLTERCWNRLVADVWRAERVCYECGSVPFRPDRLEGHECWSEDRSGPVPVRRLLSIRVLCARCMEMRFPGRAAKAGHGDRAFDRLCAANRILPKERKAYARLIEERWAARVWDDPVVEWDLSGVVRDVAVLELRPSVAMRAEGFLAHVAEAGTLRLLR
jgi:hypothetical protein